MTDNVDLVLVAARLVTFIAAFGLFGRAAFQIYAPADLRGSGGAIYRLVLPGLVVAGAVGWSFSIARQIGGSTVAATVPLITRVCLTTGFGRALVGAVVLGLAMVLNGLGGERRPRLDVGLSALLLIVLALVGHAAGRAATLAVWAAHLLAGGAWLSALPPLAQALRRESPALATLLQRFAVVGALSVALIVATGLLAIWSVVGIGGGHLGAVYTRVLILKLALVMALLALAALNRFRLTPMFASRPHEALAALKRTVLLEHLLGLGILAAAAALGQLDPAM